MRKRSRHRKGALAQGSILLPGRLLHRRSTPLRQGCCSRGCHERGLHGQEEAAAGGEAGGCCTRRAAAQAVPRAQAMHKRLFCSLG